LELELENRATTLESRATTLETTQFGAGQTLYDETYNKTKNTVYINNTLKPITVYLSIRILEYHNHLFKINGLTISYLYNNTGIRVGGWSIIVPPGASYEYYTTTSDFDIYYWYELK